MKFNIKIPVLSIIAFLALAPGAGFATPFTITVEADSISCYGADDGSAAVTAIAGGTAPFTYQWLDGESNPIPGETDSTITGLAPGNYWAWVFDDDGDFDLKSFKIEEPLNIFIFNVSATGVTCNGLSDGSISISAVGGTGTLEYSINNGATYQAGSVFNGLPAGDYNVVVRDQNNCIKSYSSNPVTVSQPAVLAITVDAVNDITCFGFTDGSIEVSVSGGTIPYNYAWTGPGAYTSGDEDISGLAQGDYDLTVTDDNGCTDNVGPLTIIEPTEITIVTDSVKDALCNGDNTGAVYVSVTEGTPGYTYDWSGPGAFGSTDQDITGLFAGSYDLEVTDANGCIKNHGPVTVTEPSAISVTQENPVVDVSCNGLSDGEISVNVSGGTLPYTYAWSGPGGFTATTQDISGLEAGSYSLIVTDGNGCTQAYGPIVVNEPPVLTVVNDSVWNVSCNGLSDGGVFITPGGGTTPYTYAWTDGGSFSAATQDITGIPAGNYSVTVTDDNGCTAALNNIPVTEPPVLDATLNTITHVTCYGGSDGSITVDVAGGTTPYSYSWTDGGTFSATTEDIFGIPAGNYTLTVTDDNGCTDILGPLAVNQPTQISVSTSSVVNVLCNGGNNGSIDIDVTDGTPPYTYAWTGPGGFTATTQDISSLEAGDYNVTVTDANSCPMNHGPVNVSEPPVLVIAQDSMDNVSCNGAGDGAIYVSVSGGVAPYGYSWTSVGGFSAGTQDITGLDPDIYSLVVTDANLCTANHGPVTVSEPAVLSVTLDLATDVSCFGAGDGAISVSVGGGTLPYSYAWTSVGGYTSDQEDISGLGPDDYTLTVTDANGCTDVLGPVNIYEPPVITITTNTVTNLTCNASGDGAIDIDVAGGTTPYAFAWSGPGGFTGNTEDISGLDAGDYSLVLTDANGCTGNHGPVTVSEPPVLVIAQDSMDNVSCNGAGDGAIYVSVSGGVAPYGYSWTSVGGFSAGTQDITGLDPDIYSLVVTDANLCTANHGPVTVSEPAVLSVTLDLATDVSCFGAGDGAISVSVGGGTLPYSYAWTSVGGYTSDQEDISGLGPDDYTLTVTDANGCTDVLGPVNIYEPPVITITTNTVTNLTCNASGDGAIDIDVAGGTTPYAFAWSGPGGFTGNTEDISGLDAGDYSLVLTDANGCTGNHGPVTVSEPAVLTMSVATTDVTCNGDGNGSATITAGGGTVPYEYSRNPLLFGWQGSNVFSPLNPGIHTFYVRDANGCQVSENDTIFEPQELLILNENTDNSGQKCYGDSAGIITITASGGTGTIEYSIDDGVSFYPTNVFTGLPGGDYHVWVRDDNGCLVEGGDPKISNPPLLYISNYAQVDITTCYDSPTGQVAIEASGGSSPIRYIMDAADTNQTGFFTGLATGGHDIDIIDSKGCTKDTSIAIASPPPIVVSAIDVVHITDCYGDNTGSLTVHASGGTGNLEFSLEGGPFQADSVFSNLQGGNYDLEVRDANGCLVYPSATINQPDSIGYDSIDLYQVTCTGDNDGAVTVYGSGGTPPYTYTLNPGALANGTGIFTGLAPGTYSVTIDDSKGCPSYTTPGQDITDPPLLLVDSVNHSVITCNGAGNGSIEIFSSGGNAPHTYSINDGGSFDPSPLATGLPPATYYVVVQDDNGCTVQGDTVILADPPPISLDSQLSTDVSSCFGDSTGTISVSASGGTGSLEYSLDSMTWQSTGDFVNLPAGTYTPLVRDSMACTMTFSDELIGQPQAITATITTTTSLNGNPGSITISDAMGGTGTLEFSVDGPGGPFVPDTVFSEWPGFYDVVIRDANGCTYQETVEVDATPPLEVNVSFTQIDCYNNNNGTISLSDVNGTGTVQYSIDDGATLQTDGNFTNLAEDTYLIYVIDDDMRIYWDTVDIVNPPPFSVSATVTPATCSRFTFDGSIVLSVSGGIPGAGYTYLWSNDSTTKDITALEEGTYDVVITDSNQCTYNGSWDVNALTTLIADAGNDTTVCNGAQITLDASGGDIYLWLPETGLSNPGIPDPVATVSDSVTYILTVTEPGGCFDKDTLTLRVHSGRGLDAGQDTTVAAGQTISLFAAGGPYSTYEWQPVSGLDDPASQSPTLTVSVPVTYIVTATTEFGCTESDSVSISLASGLFIYSGFTPNGDGTNDFWEIDFVDYYPNITVEVYDRWGKQVFFSDGYTSDKRWNGKFKGKDLPIGTYYYIINLNDGSEPLRGPVTIVR